MKERKLFLIIRALWMSGENIEEVKEKYRKYLNKIYEIESNLNLDFIPADTDTIMIVEYNEEGKKIFNMLKEIGKKMK